MVQKLDCATPAKSAHGTAGVKDTRLATAAFACVGLGIALPGVLKDAPQILGVFLAVFCAGGGTILAVAASLRKEIRSILSLIAVLVGILYWLYVGSAVMLVWSFSQVH